MLFIFNVVFWRISIWREILSQRNKEKREMPSPCCLVERSALLFLIIRTRLELKEELTILLCFAASAGCPLYKFGIVNKGQSWKENRASGEAHSTNKKIL